MTTYVLVHAPMVGPTTWRPVAHELERRGEHALVPPLLGRAWRGTPVWRQHVEAVVESIGEPGTFLVGHSGAGPLLPLVAEQRDVAGMLFVDAFPSQRVPVRDVLSTRPAPNGRGLVPAWADDETLRDLIPDEGLRRRCVAEMAGLPEEYFTEVIPEPTNAAVACGLLLFSEAYRVAAEDMRRLEAPVREIRGGHFHMLVDPVGVADAIIGLAREIRGLE